MKEPKVIPALVIICLELLHTHTQSKHTAALIYTHTHTHTDNSVVSTN